MHAGLLLSSSLDFGSGLSTDTILQPTPAPTMHGILHVYTCVFLLCEFNLYHASLQCACMYHNSELNLLIMQLFYSVTLRTQLWTSLVPTIGRRQ